jgi:hypothetical protein
MSAKLKTTCLLAHKGTHVPQYTSHFFFSTYLIFLSSYSREEAYKLTSSFKHHAHSSIHDSYFREEA